MSIKDGMKVGIGFAIGNAIVGLGVFLVQHVIYYLSN